MISSETTNPHNFPKQDDTTHEVIRKHKIYKAETNRMESGEIQRGRDYWSGYDDSIYNDLSELEDMLYHRAFIQADLDAMDYLLEVPTNTSLLMNWMTAIYEAVAALNEHDPKTALEQLTAITPVKSYYGDELP